MRRSKPQKLKEASNNNPTSKTTLTLDDLLGRARSTLDQSRQFRDGKPVSSRANPSPGRGAINPPLTTNYESKRLPAAGLGLSVPLRKPGGPAPKKEEVVVTKNAVQKEINYESSYSDSTHRGAISTSSAQRKHSSSPDSSSSSSSENENDTDSTITPPTITDTQMSSKSQNNRKVSIITPDEIPLPGESRDIPFTDLSYSKPKGKNLLERTLLIRGDPVSTESYAVLKAMMFEKEHKEAEEYTEDFDSEVLTTANKSESIEVPETATLTDHDISVEESLVSLLKDTRSSLIVEEIMENLQDLQVSDPPVETENDDDEEDLLIPSLEEQIALADLEAITNSQEEEGSEADHNDTTSIAPSKSIRSSTNPSKASMVSKSRSKATTTSSKKQQKTSSKSSKALILSSNRASTRKSFQNVLSKVTLDDEEDDKKSASYVPPVTKPQMQIQDILKKEIYQKELKKIRSMQKKEEKNKTKTEETKAQNKITSRETEESRIPYKEPSYTKLLLPELIHNPLPGAVSKHPSNNLGAPYFNRDGSLGMDYAIENYPRSPDENFSRQAQKMDIPQLVREVLASNERMYKMTVDASKEMGKQYGKNAKLLLKMKKSKEHLRNARK